LRPNLRINEAEALQASLRPNPELEAEIADFGGTGETSGVDLLETTVSLVQAFELGGDRKKRLALAKQRGDLIGWNYETKRLNVISETRRRFLGALVAERKWQLAQELDNLTPQAQGTNQSSGENGPDNFEGKTQATTLAELERQLEQLTSHLERRGLEHTRRESRHALAAMWGSQSVNFDGLAGKLDERYPVPPLEILAQHLESHPRIARWKSAVQRHRATEALAEAEAVPNLETRMGGVHGRESGDQALELEATLPLPVFDRRQGDRLAARLSVERARHQRRAVRLKLWEQLRQAHGELNLAAEGAQALNDTILPTAQRAVKAAEQAFERDQISLDKVIEARRQLLKVREKRLEFLADYHKAVIEIEALIARSMRSV